MSLLSVRDLSVTFDTPGQSVEAVRGISFELERGQQGKTSAVNLKAV